MIMSKKGALPLLAMPVFLILSCAIDGAAAAIQAFSSSTFRVMEATWGHVLVELVFAGAVIFMAWLVLTTRANQRLAGWLFLAVGLVAFFISTPFQIALGSLWAGVPVSQRGWLYHFILSLGFYGFLTRAGALIVVLGLVDLFRKSRNES
jgi:hypothetical protein